LPVNLTLAGKDQVGAALRNLLGLRGYSFDDLDASIVSSTVPALEPEWTEMADRYLGHTMLTVGPGTRTGMAIRYDNPREIGADRLVNAVAIRERFGGPAVCVDFGTATTFDVVSRDGEYLGGAIMTGIEISLEALTERGARLPKIDLAPPRSVIGKNTIDAIRSGVVYGYAGAIDAILRRLYDELGERTDVIATGGLSHLVAPYSEEIEEIAASYRRIGYDVLPTSVRTGQGIEELRARLKGRISAFCGPSGVGKSSLLNAVQPGLSLKTGDVGSVTYKGRHTTGSIALLPLAFGGWVADTPGLRQVVFWDLDPEDVAVVRKSPVIRRRSGEQKFEVDIRRADFRLADRDPRWGQCMPG